MKKPKHSWQCRNEKTGEVAAVCFKARDARFQAVSKSPYGGYPRDIWKKLYRRGWKCKRVKVVDWDIWKIISDLLFEIRQQHRDKDDPWYNGCDEGQCYWCDQAEDVIRGIMREYSITQAQRRKIINPSLKPLEHSRGDDDRSKL